MELKTLQLTIGLLSFLLLVLVYRLLRLLLRRRKQRKERPTDLLFDTLREQTLREQEAARGRDQAQVAYATLEEVHHTVMEHMPIGIMVLREDHTVHFVNPHGMTILGLDTATDERLNVLCPELYAACEACAWGAKEPSHVFQHIYDNRLRLLELTLSSLPEAGQLLVVQDVTRMRRLEERVQAKRDLELMGEMASGVTHELKNALATISGHVQMLPYGEVSEHAGHIMHEVEHLLRFVKLFSKSTRGETLDSHQINVANWLTDLETHWRNHPKGSTVTVAPPTTNLHVMGDRTLLDTVLNNLILNGIQSGGENPAAVTVRAYPMDGGVAVEVVDQGPGFPVEIRGRMFAPFVTAKPGGTGLGLFQCRKIMMEHQGRLSVDHGPPTRVICHFPEDFDPISSVT